jgi:DNA polymerase III epsilon subunit-like protein
MSGGGPELVSKDWANVRYAVVDVEGNGQQLPDLVELGVVHIVDGQVGEPQSWLVKPAWRISPFATRIHGISNDDVANSPALPMLLMRYARALDVDAVVATS